MKYSATTTEAKYFHCRGLFTLLDKLGIKPYDKAVRTGDNLDLVMVYKE